MSKTRKQSLLLIGAFVFALLCAIVVFTSSTQTASAATTPRYTVTFNYEHYYQSNTNITMDGSGNNVTTTTQLSGANNKRSTISFYIYGSEYSGSGTLANGGALNSSVITIVANSTFANNGFTVKNGSGATVGTSSSKTITLSGLSDGRYDVSVSAYNIGWTASAREYRSYKTTCSFSFMVDTSAPKGTLYGGTSVVTNGGSTKASYVKFSASDSGAGIKTCYVQKPGKSYYEAYTSNSQLTEEGKFSFYCVDNANNTSAVYTVTRDSTAPVLSCEQSNFYSTTDKGFTVKATDTLSGAKLYYKTPSMSSYVQTSGSISISDTAQDGKYYFYAEDGLSNRSNEVWIELKVAVPEATIVRSDTDNGVYATWTDNSTAKLNGQTYSKGTWIRTEGDYTLILQNTAGRTSTYTFSVGHSYKLSKKVNATCTEQGYSVYQCTSCNDSYRSDYIRPNGHRYEESEIEPTCTERGGVRHTCSVCGDFYDTEGAPAIGHKYLEETIPATCTESGYLNHLCTVCGFEYQTDVVSPAGHSYSSVLIQAGTCIGEGRRKHSCAVCGDTYETVIPALGHQYEITDVDAGDGKTVRTYTCAVCGDTFTQDLGNQYEKVTNYVEYLFNLYSPYMVWVFLATAGVWSIVLGVMIIIAHKNEDKEKAKKMLVNYGIGLIVIFCILIACPYLIKGIAALIA